jgi:Leucine-rich repeat (LRR) protein
MESKENHFGKLSFDVFGYIMGFISLNERIMEGCLICRRWYAWIHQLPMELHLNYIDLDQEKFDKIIQTWHNIVVIETPYNFQDEIFNISSLSECTNLKVLRASELPISDISPLQFCKKLEELDLSETEVGDISSLRECPNLIFLELDRTNVSDISALSFCKKLKALYLRRTHVSDLTPLKECTKLEHLILYKTYTISDISPLVSCGELKILDIRKAHVHDISHLPNCKNLERVYIGEKQISNSLLIRDLIKRGVLHIDLRF